MSLKPKRESSVEREGVRRAKAAGWSQIKVYHKRGWPDRLFFRLGEPARVWVEFKRPDGHARLQQEVRIRKLRRDGETVLLIDNWLELMEGLDGAIRA